MIAQHHRLATEVMPSAADVICNYCNPAASFASAPFSPDACTESGRHRLHCNSDYSSRMSSRFQIHMPRHGHEAHLLARGRSDRLTANDEVRKNAERFAPIQARLERAHRCGPPSSTGRRAGLRSKRHAPEAGQNGGWYEPSGRMSSQERRCAFRCAPQTDAAGWVLR